MLFLNCRCILLSKLHKLYFCSNLLLSRTKKCQHLPFVRLNLAIAKSKVASKCMLFCLSCFRPGGILVCKLEGASFWEKTPGADYLPHHLTRPEGTCICNYT